MNYWKFFFGTIPKIASSLDVAITQKSSVTSRISVRWSYYLYISAWLHTTQTQILLLISFWKRRRHSFTIRVQQLINSKWLTLNGLFYDFFFGFIQQNFQLPEKNKLLEVFSNKFHLKNATYSIRLYLFPCNLLNSNFISGSNSVDADKFLL